MRFVDVLMEEHRGFATMLDVLDAVGERVKDGRDVPPGMLDGLLDFFEHFTDGHHLLEEQVLFPLLAEHGVGRDLTVVNALLAQHDAGRSYSKKMRVDLERMKGGDPEAAEHFAAHAQGYAELIREHIRIEDSYFYKAAEEILTSEEKERVSAQFSQAGGRRVAPADRDRYLRMIDEYPAVAGAWPRRGGRTLGGSARG